MIDQNIDTSDTTCRLFFNMLGSVAQFETEIRTERQLDRIKKAKGRGVQFGSKPKLCDAQIAELCQRWQNGEPIRELMADYGISRRKSIAIAISI